MAALCVLASGMVTPLGYNGPASLAALRAGISAVQATGWVDHESGRRLRGARTSLPHGSEGLEKVADLLAPAIDECLRAAAPEPPQAIPWLVATAAPQRPGRVPGLDEHLLDEVQARLGLVRHPASHTFAADQTGGMLALLQAQRLLAEGHARRVVVAGVDSYLREDTLRAYLKRRRLMSESNSNGFFPGEAGTAVLVAQGAPAAQGAEGAALAITGWGQGQEPAPIEGTQPLQARGLSEAARAALDDAGVTMRDIAFRLTDLSGEHYKFKEAMIVALRLDRGPRDEPLDLWHPVEYLGEVGAAVLPCLLGWAQHAFAHGYAPGPRALCHVGNDAGQRAALVVQPLNLERHP